MYLEERKEATRTMQPQLVLFLVVTVGRVVEGKFFACVYPCAFDMCKGIQGGMKYCTTMNDVLVGSSACCMDGSPVTCQTSIPGQFTCSCPTAQICPTRVPTTNPTPWPTHSPVTSSPTTNNPVTPTTTVLTVSPTPSPTAPTDGNGEGNRKEVFGLLVFSICGLVGLVGLVCCVWYCCFGTPDQVEEEDIVSI